MSSIYKCEEGARLVRKRYPSPEFIAAPCSRTSWMGDVVKWAPYFCSIFRNRAVDKNGAYSEATFRHTRGR